MAKVSACLHRGAFTPEVERQRMMLNHNANWSGFPQPFAGRAVQVEIQQGRRESVLEFEKRSQVCRDRTFTDAPFPTGYQYLESGRARCHSADRGF